MKRRGSLIAAAALAVGVFAAGCWASTQATPPGTGRSPAAGRPTSIEAPPTETTAAPNSPADTVPCTAQTAAVRAPH